MTSLEVLQDLSHLDFKAHPPGVLIVEACHWSTIVYVPLTNSSQNNSHLLSKPLFWKENKNLAKQQGHLLVKM